MADSAFSGVEETLSKLGDVEFTRIAPETAVTEDQRVLVVPVVLRTPDRDESRVVGGLTLGRQDGVWLITARSLRALLIQALDAATGTSRAWRMTRTMLEILGATLRSYADEHAGSLPSALDDLVAETRYGEPYLSAVPGDGWGRSLHYVPHPDGTFELRSLGEDDVLAPQLQPTADTSPPR